MIILGLAVIPPGVGMALSEVTPGTMMKVLGIEGGKEVRRKLLGLGILPGVDVQILIKRSTGPLLISVMGQQVCLGRGIAEKVKVA